jgi:murein DD-endopeptidase MepM/ murein hydrolase activator NlpD
VILPRLRHFAALACATVMMPAIASDVAAPEVVRQQAVPLDVRVPAAPGWIPSRDGAHALYELHLANYRALPLELLRVDVVDASNGAMLASLEGEKLLADLSRPGRTDGPGNRNYIAGGETAVLFMELVRAPGEALPAAVRHAWYVRRAASEGEEPSTRTWLMVSAPVAIKPAPGYVLGPPLSGDGWLAANGLGNRANHRRTLFAIDGQVRISQRYAIDFIRIGANGRVAGKGMAENADFHGYGADLLAVADGTVAAVRDGIPENRPADGDMAVDITLETIAGNSVTLDVGGAYVTYAHLQPGSLKVAPGQAVKRGQVLGKLGNSGNSDAPHLHLQVTDLPAALAAEGLPFVFEHFAWTGSVADLDSWMGGGEAWHPAAPTPQPRRGELPLDGDVIDFPP